MIGNALQTRLLDAARRHFGPGGDTLLREAAQRVAGVPLEQVSYAQLPALFAAVETDAAPAAGREVAAAVAADLDQLAVDADAGLSGRLIGTVAKRLGPAAEPFLTTSCARLGIALDTVERSHLPDIAAMVRQDAGLLLGQEVAEQLAAAVEECRAARPPGLVDRVREIAALHAGASGEAALRDLCRRHLEVDLDELDVEGVRLLARAVERDGAAPLGAERVAAFLAAAREAATSPAEGMRAKVIELARDQIGPAGPQFVRRACAKHGLPFEAVDFEHVMWLAEVMRTEAAPLAGKRAADELARGIRGFLTGNRQS
jgi:hypothetical protein